MSTITPIQFVALCTLVFLVLACTALVLAVVCVRKTGPTDIFGDSGGVMSEAPSEADLLEPQADEASQDQMSEHLEPLSPSFTDDIRRAMERKHFGTKIKDDCGAMDFTEDRKEWTKL